jgi:hypothetical protein
MLGVEGWRVSTTVTRRAWSSAIPDHTCFRSVVPCAASRSTLADVPKLPTGDSSAGRTACSSFLCTLSPGACAAELYHIACAKQAAKCRGPSPPQTDIPPSVVCQCRGNLGPCPPPPPLPLPSIVHCITPKSPPICHARLRERKQCPEPSNPLQISSPTPTTKHSKSTHLFIMAETLEINLHLGSP